MNPAMGTYISKTAHINFSEAVLLSLLGLAIVFVALIIIALAIMAFSKIFQMMGISDAAAPKKVATPAPAPAATNAVEDETAAVIIAAVTEELRKERGSFNIKSITKIN